VNNYDKKLNEVKVNLLKDSGLEIKPKPVRDAKKIK